MITSAVTGSCTRLGQGSAAHHPVDQAAIDKEKPNTDDNRPNDLLGLHRLVQEHVPEDQRRDRNEKRNKHHVARSRADEDLEEYDVSQGRSEDRQRYQRVNGRLAWRAQRPGLIDDRNDRRHHERRTDELACCRFQWRNAGQPPSSPKCGKPVAKSAGRTKSYAQGLSTFDWGLKPAQYGNADDTEQDTDDSVDREALLQEDRHDDDGKKGGHRV